MCFHVQKNNYPAKHVPYTTLSFLESHWNSQNVAEIETKQFCVRWQSSCILLVVLSFFNPLTSRWHKVPGLECLSYMVYFVKWTPSEMLNISEYTFCWPMGSLISLWSFRVRHRKFEFSALRVSSPAILGSPRGGSNACLTCPGPGSKSQRLVGITKTNHPWLGMVNIPPIITYLYLWWFGGWFVIVLPTLHKFIIVHLWQQVLSLDGENGEIPNSPFPSSYVAFNGAPQNMARFAAGGV